MISMSNILALTEAGTGFSGGACVDTMPHLSLTEAINELPVSIMENQLCALTENAKINELIVESTVTALTTGSAVDTDAIVEASIKGLMAQVKKFFQGIINFLKSIIAKIGVHINKVRMTGKQMYAHYGDKLDKKDYTDLTYNGWKFVDVAKAFPKATTYDKNVSDLLKAGIGGIDIVEPVEFAKSLPAALEGGEDEAKKTAYTEAIDKAKKATEAITDVSSDTRVYNMAVALTGLSDLSETSWKADIKKHLYGDDKKIDLKFGTDFTVDSVKNELQNAIDLQHLEAEYKALLNCVTTDKEHVERAVADLEKENKKSSSAVAAAYTSAYLSIYQSATNAIGAVKSAKYSAAKDKNAQCKAIFAKMLNYNPKKPDNNSAIDDDIAFEIEL